MNHSSGLFMSAKESIRYQIVSKYIYGKLHRDKAAQILNVSERTITRLAQKIKDKGICGIKHGNFGNKFCKRLDPKPLDKIIHLYKTKYFDFNLKHFMEVLENEYEIKLSYSTLWRYLSKEKLIKKPRRRRPRRHIYRTRMPQEGLLLQMDGCHHKFNGKDVWCLIAAIDDATSGIPCAEFFGDGETTINCMKVLEQIIQTKGVPKAIYTDRAGWTGGTKRSDFSQFKRACTKLGIQLIFADTPEAKGRIERSFRTIQDRLIPEIRLNKATTLEKANQYLKDQFLEKYWNKRNIVEPADTESAYTPLDPWLDLNQVLCLEEDRVIGSDQTVSWKGQRYVVKGAVGSLARYMAVFRADLSGKTRVFVQHEEVNLSPVEKEPIRDYVDRIEIKRKNPLKIEPDLWIKMYNQILDIRQAVSKHRIHGKPLKL